MQDQVAGTAFAPGEAVNADRPGRLGLLRAREGCMISPLAVFVPADAEGTTRARGASGGLCPPGQLKNGPEQQKRTPRRVTPGGLRASQIFQYRNILRNADLIGIGS